MARSRERGLQNIAEENDLKAYQADPSGFLWALLEVVRHGDNFAEPDFQALIERGRLAAMGQQGMIDHSEDIKQTDEEQRKREYEQSQPGVGPPRSVRPDEGDSPMAEAQRLADQDPRAIEAAERQSEAERLGISERSTSEDVRRQSEAAEEAVNPIRGKDLDQPGGSGRGQDQRQSRGTAPAPPPRSSSPTEEAERLTGDDDDEDELDSDDQDTGRTDAARLEQSENVEPSPGTQGDRAVAERKARERGLEIRDYGTAGDWRVYDPKTGKMASKMKLEEPV